MVCTRDSTMIIECFHCSAKIDDTCKFCHQCGNPPQSKICTKCKPQCSPDLKFCSQNGTPVSIAAGPSRQAISYCYDIKIDENDAAKRCHLKGNYIIHVSATGIGLLDNRQNVIYSWPCAYIRSYGVENNNNVLVIEVGRKSDSGEGQFRFQTRKAQEIHALIQGLFTKLLGSHNPIPTVSPFLPQQVANRQGSSISEESERSIQLPRREQSTVSSSCTDGTDNSLGAITFDVKIEENETAKRCHLKGNYTIQISTTGIGLLDSKQSLVYSWPYNYIRKCGVENNKNVFFIEVGRKCDSGEGQFRFQTRKAQEIYDLVQNRFTQMQRSQNPMAKVAPLIPHQVTKRQGSNISEESDGSSHLPQRNQSTVSSSSRDGIHNSWVGNTEAEKPSATNMRKSERKPPDVIPKVPAAEKISVNGSEGDRQSVPGPAVSHISPKFLKELEEKLQKPNHNAVQQNVEDTQNDPRQNKKKTKKEKRESDKEKKKKEGEKENNKKWSLFSKKMKENDRIKSSERDIKSDSSKDDQKPHHAVPNQSSRFYEEVDLSEPVADTSSTGLYSGPFEHTKDKKKLGPKKSNDGRKTPPTARKPQELYSEPVTLANPQNIYSVAIKPGKSGGPVVYSEVNKFRQDAWKNYGEAEEFHEEDYLNIQSANEMQQQTSNEPPLPPRPSDFDDDDDDGTYAGDSDYNTLDFEKKVHPSFKSVPASQGHIYGTSSGPVGPLPEQEYDSLSSGEEEEEEEEEEDQYAEADLNPYVGYEETKIKPPLPKPLLSKPQKSPPAQESLYEDI